MPEIPEIASRSAEMNAALAGKTIQSMEILQPKCLNIEPDEYTRALTGATLQETTYRGKWLFTRTTQGWMLTNLGMGGEILLTDRDHMPEKYRLVYDFTDKSCLAINFWWFGYAHYIAADQLASHTLSAKLGPNVLDLSEADFSARIAGQKGRLKAFLLDQTRIAGIGNAYIHDILFFAHLHPLRPINTLSSEEIKALYEGIQKGLRPSLEKGGAFYEKNLYGQGGGFKGEDIVIGYREGKPCPVCGTPIEKLKTGSTTSFICPGCQK